jgi:hypothetical protein
VRTFNLVHEEVAAGIRLHEDLAARHEDVTATAEIVVVHDVVVNLEPSTHYQEQDGSDRAREGQLDPTVTSDQPAANSSSPAPEPNHQEEGDNRSHYDAADHYPARSLEDPLNYGNQWIREGGSHNHRIDEPTGKRVLYGDCGGPVGRVSLYREGPRPHDVWKVDGGHKSWRRVTVTK